MTTTIIIGGPLCGKSTLAHTIHDTRPIYCGDPISTVREPHNDVTYLPENLDWSASSQHVANQWLTRTGDWVCEGQVMARALRKWLTANWTDDGLTHMPADEIIVLFAHHPEAPTPTTRQAAMHKAVMTVWAEIAPHFEPVTRYMYWQDGAYARYGEDTPTR